MVGVDHDTIKPGCSMVLDPFGEIVVESTALGDDVVVAWLAADRVALSSGRRYLRARRPELYEELVAPPPPDRPPLTAPGWRLERPDDGTATRDATTEA